MLFFVRNNTSIFLHVYFAVYKKHYVFDDVSLHPFRFSMMESCWELQDSDRPTFSEIVSFLDKYLGRTAEYLDLTFNRNNSSDATYWYFSFNGYDMHTCIV